MVTATETKVSKKQKTLDNSNTGSSRIVQLSGKRARFVAHYLNNGNATEAAKLAGYSSKSAYSQGSRLLKNAEIRAAVALVEQRAAERMDVSASWILDRLLLEATYPLNSGGERISALQLLGKNQRLFVDVSESTVTHDVQALREYTPAQLRAMLAEATRQQALEAPKDA